MAVITRYLEHATKGNGHAIDLTPDLARMLRETGLRHGACTVFVPGATGGLTTVEYEPGLLLDLQELWERLAPARATYHHDATWHDGNGHSHVRASLVGPSLTVPFVDGAFTLGTWQQVVFLDFDIRPRTRRLVLQFIGE
ncbi:MAG: secondary thiamine-phosphate synthase enzyme [Candidatus Ozemobacter sibiricus]|jgi:secondary thiamine-phosphate synthase enzyme|uniref:Secondary thiamine-phosphate synthase enzyme n=1 Tax=Candidatus Ozemobacter sibiricus TaxID=2268124 RepID=A0A367ZTQ1_9BACT|nr:MAG: secondary thiamine-phosphate synthase enzyme [Candidatus Ozemobacter sibiricus]